MRRGLAAGRCGSAAATRVVSPERGGVAVGDGGGSLRVAFCARSRLSYDPFWSVLRSAHAHHAFLLGGFAFDHACLFSFVRKRETACGMLRSYSAGSGSPLERSRMACGYRACLVRFELVRFFMAIPTEYEETRSHEERGRRRGRVRFCGSLSALLCFPRGVRWGCAPQTCAKESSTLWTLFIWFAVWGRCCASLLALLCFPRGGRWGCAPQTAPRRPVSLDSLLLIRGVGALYAGSKVRITPRSADCIII